MSNGMPVIDIIFRQLAATAVERSKRGILAVIIKDDTPGADVASKKTYKREDELDSKLYTADNLKNIKRCFLVAVNKVVVISIPTTAKFSAAIAILKMIKYNYVCTTDTASQQELANYVIAFNASSPGKKVVALTWQVTTADSKYIINLKNTTLTEIQTAEDGTKSNVAIPAVSYLPRIAAVLANLPLNRSITYYVFEDLAEVDDVTTEELDLDALVKAGWFFLWNDDDTVKAGRGVNTLTTYTSTDKEDMSSILIMESINLMIEDIYNTFKNDYLGKYKNYLDNQKLFIAAVNSYFTEMSNEEILDPDYTGNDDLGTTGNQAFINVDAQRNAWIAVGKTKAADWSKAKVESMTFKKKLFLAAGVKILDAMEDLNFVINME